jgi:hypothetical protein
MTGTASLPYKKAAEQVEEMMDQGTPFEHVEDAIETAQAPQDDKAALWLFAWSLRDSARRTPTRAPGAAPPGEFEWEGWW